MTSNSGVRELTTCSNRVFKRRELRLDRGGSGCLTAAPDSAEGAMVCSLGDILRQVVVGVTNVFTSLRTPRNFVWEREESVIAKQTHGIS